jgi:hypothetical protein
MPNIVEIGRILLAGLVFSCVLQVEPPITAQTASSPKAKQQLDNFAAQATELVFNAGLQAASLKVPEERIEAQLEAANILLDIKPDASLRLVNAAWDSLNDWAADDNGKSARQSRRLFSRLRSRILDLYSKLDPVKAAKLAASLSDNDSKSKEKDEDNPNKPTGRQRADELVKVGLTTVNSDPEKAIAVALSSLTLTDKISVNLSMISEALKDRPMLLQKFESALAQTLTYKSSIDGDDLRAIVGLITVDLQMQRATQLAFLGFLLRSAEQLATMAREARMQGKPITLGEDVIGNSYFVLGYFVRKVVATYLPEQVADLDSELEEISSITPDSSRDLVYERTTSDPLETQLKRASGTANGPLRDGRLARLAFHALVLKPPNIEIASDAVAQISNPETKSVLGDYVQLSKTMVLVAKADFEGAEKRAREVSKSEWRAWALMALGSTKPDKSGREATRLYADALGVLDKSSPSPLKVDLTFILADLWGAYDLERASEAVWQAIKTANHITPPTDLVTADSWNLNGFFAHIGKLNFAPGMPVKDLADVAFPSIVGRLAGEDWAQAARNSEAVEDLSLQIRYKLTISKAVLDKEREKGAKRVLSTN